MTEAASPEHGRFRASVHGRVQGVGFRYATLHKARELGVVGYVRNAWDGTVEVVAEGPADALQRLISWLHAGPRSAHVSDVQLHWQTPRREFAEFEVCF